MALRSRRDGGGLRRPQASKRGRRNEDTSVDTFGPRTELASEKGGIEKLATEGRPELAPALRYITRRETRCDEWEGSKRSPRSTDSASPSLPASSFPSNSPQGTAHREHGSAIGIPGDQQCRRSRRRRERRKVKGGKGREGEGELDLTPFLPSVLVGTSLTYDHQR